MRWGLAMLALLGGTVCSLPAAAEVASADDSGFEVSGSEAVAADPAKLWQDLIRPALWWDSGHTWSGKAANLSIAAVAGGCFCEKMARGGSVEHMRVIRVEPGRRLTMTGALGPLQSEPVQGVLTVTIAARDGGSLVSWSYLVSGLRKTKGTALALPVSQVISAQFANLARHAASRANAAPQRR